MHVSGDYSNYRGCLVTSCIARKEWAFGKRNFRDAFLGNEQIIPSEEKWKFIFKRNLPA